MYVYQCVGGGLELIHAHLGWTKLGFAELKKNVKVGHVPFPSIVAMLQMNKKTLKSTVLLTTAIESQGEAFKDVGHKKNTVVILDLELRTKKWG